MNGSRPLSLRRLVCAGRMAAIGNVPIENLRERRPPHSIWVGGGFSVVTFLIHGATLTPGVPPTDSGELAVAAWILAVAYAPGFPLWTALGWLWSHLLPIGRVRVAARSRLAHAASGHGSEERRPGPASGSGVGQTFWTWSTVAEVVALSAALAAAILLLVMCWTGPCLRSAPRQPTGARPAQTGSLRR